MNPMSGQEKTQLFTDVFAGRVPKRVPVYPIFPREFALQYAGKDWLSAVNVIPSGMQLKICAGFLLDAFSINAIRFLRCTNARRPQLDYGVQRFYPAPDVEGMSAEDPMILLPLHRLIVDKMLTSLYGELDGGSPQKTMAFAKAFKVFYDELAVLGNYKMQLIAQYDLGIADLICGVSSAPFDFVADQLRGFRGILTDVRRIPEKVLAACDAIVGLMVKMGLPPYQAPNTAALIPLHMAPYMRENDFEKLYWPGLKTVVEEMAKLGIRSHIMLENDFMRYIDYFDDLPAGVILNFETGDPLKVKKTLGQKHILTGFYPTTLLKTGTKQQCIDKAKELLDALAPGGGYIFSFDKVLITADSVNTENLKAVLEYVTNNSDY